ncbi:HMA2 domain-containing protein [Clostridium botulinum]|uniref:Uncharacterized protein n=1 Tax=Clostridium botulinum TaxID=1491 RepID=A0A9Q1UXF6_CLOBO|nr:hypothetical protein [Clostridium botulinum]AEB76294.1 conserved hypothetical protein [Clostridium botulinum BKT015925]KEH99998.1 hypothetical protein Z953_10545 [Clostridium botulinum D str. 16868]KEI04262.1 hypothetical protein Y848_02330 [Clostridium botulinum C/D str. Sp77]KLU75796.1 hypothetical protein CBC3_06740 [Clostridium botulinum V891]KOA75004.1 hypothetical protein ADU77_11375 [Clostridium botulinum]
MFNIKLYIVKHLKKIKIIHSIPGRIRLKLPNIGNVPEEFRKYDDFIIKAVKILDGVNEISFNYVIGTALITYDTHKVYEKKILGWIEDIVDISVKNLKFIEKYAENNLDFVVETLEQELNDKVKKYK